MYVYIYIYTIWHLTVTNMNTEKQIKVSFDSEGSLALVDTG